jgi:hypothetical protein
MLESIRISSPLHDKQMLMFKTKKQAIGRRAYSDITKVKMPNRQIDLYERKKQDTQEDTDRYKYSPRESLS